ncbi:glycosyltransferase [Candidatus Desantisbacteria bacterium]|nr:glycosyltransferase [Candidatus Desantisbacteria bacterium]
MKATLIISFYNKIDYLKLVLAGMERQSSNEFEIIIADDGSREEIVRELKELMDRSSLAIKHVWQEDKGFRKCRILNKAICKAETNYLIFIDGDCVPHREFIREHIENRSKSVCLAGRRINLSKKITERLTTETIKSGYLENSQFSLFFDYIFGRSTCVEEGVFFTSPGIRKFINRKKRGIVGSNLSLSMEDIMRVNGFDERYEQPSIGEDSDIQFRLELNGVKICSVKNIAIQYHLYHELLPRPKANIELFEKIRKDMMAFTPYGIKQI